MSPAPQLLVSLSSSRKALRFPVIGSGEQTNHVILLLKPCSDVRLSFLSRVNSFFVRSMMSSPRSMVKEGFVKSLKNSLRSMVKEGFELHFQIIPAKNTLIEQYVLNPALRALISLQDLFGIVRILVEERITALDLFTDVWSPGPPTISISNLRLSPTIASFLAGVDNVVFASVIEPTLCQRQRLEGDKLFRVDLLSSPSTGKSCPLHFNLLPHLERESEKGQFAPPLPCALISTYQRNILKYCARRLDRPETLCLLLDICSNTLNYKECDDNMLRYISVINYWLRHDNVEVGLDPSKLFSLSPNSIVLSVLMKAKLALEIHLVSLRSFVEFRTGVPTLVSNQVR